MTLQGEQRSVTKCERCGFEISSVMPFMIKLWGGGKTDGTSWILCSKCVHGFRNWMMTGVA
jgi:hypothetical protein